MPLGPTGLTGDLQTIVNALQALTIKVGDLIQQISVSAPPVSGIGEAPNDTTLYGRKSLAWSHITHNDIVDWAASLPPGSTPSSTTPLMDGTAAVGSSLTYARGDHVHPTNTSLLPLTGGTITGLLTLNGGLSLNVASMINAANDTAAASAGVAVGGLYRNGSAAMVRVT